MTEDERKSRSNSDASRPASNRRSWLKGAALAAASSPVLIAASKQSEPAQKNGSQKNGAKADRIAASDSNNVVETNSGKVRGYARNGIHIFRGIPYGASTAGENRFMPPQKPKPWPGVRSTTWYGEVSPFPPRTGWHDDENAFMFQWNDGQPGEDCLRINLWTPGINDNGKRPVMVWLHGGGFASGSGQELLSYDGENLCHRGNVVVVTLNHRLNAFGFLNLAEAGGERFATSGNVGMMDIVLALQWVRDNIANFGGDPNTVMIFGQSGGGGKVNTLMAMPSAKGLFHRASTQSGSMLRVAEPQDSYKLADAVLRELNISNNDVVRLQSTPWDQLLNAALAAQKRVAPRPPGPPNFRRLARQIGWAPVVDGTVLPRQPFDPDAPAISADVPLMVGTVLNEFVNGIGKPDAFAMTDQQLSEKVAAQFGDRSKEVIDSYREVFPGVRPFQIYSVIMASPVRGNAVKQARLKAAAAKAPAYLYWFQWQTPILDGRPMAFHCAELSFCFDHTDRCETMTGGGPRARALAAKVSEAWISFARTGDPGHKGLPHWSAFSAETVPTMIFDDECRLANNPDGHALKLIDSITT